MAAATQPRDSGKGQCRALPPLSLTWEPPEGWEGAPGTSGSRAWSSLLTQQIPEGSLNPRGAPNTAQHIPSAFYPPRATEGTDTLLAVAELSLPGYFVPRSCCRPSWASPGAGMDPAHEQGPAAAPSQPQAPHYPRDIPWNIPGPGSASRRCQGLSPTLGTELGEASAAPVPLPPGTARCQGLAQPPDRWIQVGSVEGAGQKQQGRAGPGL